MNSKRITYVFLTFIQYNSIINPFHILKYIITVICNCNPKKLLNKYNLQKGHTETVTKYSPSLIFSLNMYHHKNTQLLYHIILKIELPNCFCPWYKHNLNDLFKMLEKKVGPVTWLQ